MKYLNALNKIDGMGPKKMKVLMNFFGSGTKIWQASLPELCQTGISENFCQKIIEKRQTIDPDQEWEKILKENLFLATMEDENYPQLLKEIPDCPYLLYMKGDLSCLKMPLVAIVGSRKLTSYGSQVARSISKEIALREICVVSGLAFGIDACAHKGALDCSGKTIAVLGTALDNITPHSNFSLAQEILRSGGLLISEFPLEAQVAKFSFPMRNRIMAGMSSGTLVIEAAEKSGSLITANLALDYNREVFAVPGPITSPQSAGTNMLIKEGAKLVTNADDVLQELKFGKPAKKAEQEEKSCQITLNENEEKIYRQLSHESCHIDIIARLTKLDTSTVSSVLAILEIKGVVKNIGGQNYIRL